MAPSSPDAILHLATLHLLSQAGFASTSQAASLSLSSVAAQYLRVVAQDCVDRATLAGRSKVAAHDVVAALEELGAGYGIEELMEYGADHQGVEFESGGIDDLAQYLQEGLKTDDPVATLRLVHDDQRPELEEEEAEEEESEDDESMEIDNPEPVHLNPPPDFAWLPPLPGTVKLQPSEPGKPADTTAELPQAAPASIADRYRVRIPFASSSFALRATPYVDPPAPPDRPLPGATSSLPSLIETYNATRAEPSLTLRQTDTRRQALELLRRHIAPPDRFSPSASLSAPNFPPAPRVSPIVPSHSDTLPPQLLPINPNPTTLLSQLVHTIQSPHLPPDLRERLTSLRPPLAQKRDGEPILYGPPVRGPDTAALLRAKGKPFTPEDEAWLYATWDSGPKGIKKWGKAELPTGKKVIKHVIGEEAPRRAGPPPEEKEKRTLKLSLSRGSASASPGMGAKDASPGPAPPATPGAGGAPMTLTIPAVGNASHLSPSPTPGTPGTSLKLKLAWNLNAAKNDAIPGPMSGISPKTITPNSGMGSAVDAGSNAGPPSS